MSNSSSDSNQPLVEKMDVNMPTDLGKAGHLNSDPETEFDINGPHDGTAEVPVKQDDEGATGGDVEPDDNIDHSPFPVNKNEADTDKDKLLKKIENKDRKEFFQIWGQNTSLTLGPKGEYREGREYEIKEILQKKESSRCSVSVIRDLATGNLLIMKTFPKQDKSSCCLNEVEALCKLDIEGFLNSPKLIAVQTYRGEVIVYMELLKGCTLHQLDRRRVAFRINVAFFPRLPVALYMLTVLRQLVDIINNKHKLYHLDLHSDNVFFVISDDERPFETFIIDFGEAKTWAYLEQNKSELELHKLLSQDKLQTLVLFCELCGVSININDLENDWEARVDRCQESDETKRLIKEIIQKGLDVQFQPTEGEKTFIEFLNSKLKEVLAHDEYVDLNFLTKIKTAFENFLLEIEKEREEKQKASHPKSANTGTTKETTMVPTSGVSSAQTLSPREKSNFQNEPKFALQSAPNQTSELSLIPLQEKADDDCRYRSSLLVSELAPMYQDDAKEVTDGIDKMSLDDDTDFIHQYDVKEVLDGIDKKSDDDDTDLIDQENVEEVPDDIDKKSDDDDRHLPPLPVSE